MGKRATTGTGGALIDSAILIVCINTGLTETATGPPRTAAVAASVGVIESVTCAEGVAMTEGAEEADPMVDRLAMGSPVRRAIFGPVPMGDDRLAPLAATFSVAEKGECGE